MKYNLLTALFLLIFCTSITGNTSIMANWGTLIDAKEFNEKEYWGSVNKWQQEFYERSEKYNEKRRRIDLALKLSLVVFFIIFTISTLYYGKNKKRCIFRLLTWYPLFTVAWTFLCPWLYPLALASTIVIVPLWFQKKCPKKELLISTIIYVILLASFFLYASALASLANQGAGH